MFQRQNRNQSVKMMSEGQFIRFLISQYLWNWVFLPNFLASFAFSEDNPFLWAGQRLVKRRLAQVAWLIMLVALVWAVLSLSFMLGQPWASPFYWMFVLNLTFLALTFFAIALHLFVGNKSELRRLDLYKRWFQILEDISGSTVHSLVVMEKKVIENNINLEMVRQTKKFLAKKWELVDLGDDDHEEISAVHKDLGVMLDALESNLAWLGRNDFDVMSEDECFYEAEEELHKEQLSYKPMFDGLGGELGGDQEVVVGEGVGQGI